MADEAFALSPISARATLPGEEDYAAISEAFMETSRGRWFLTEYAKRNRNADTRMVLDAVARIEQSLVAQKEETLATQRESLAAQQQAAAADAANAAVTAATAATEAAANQLSEALAAIRTAVEAAQTSAVGAIDGLALEPRLAGIRKGSRVLREIAWRLREIGNDSRICDLIDSQVAVIENAAEPIASDAAKAVLGAAFASIEGRLAEFGNDDLKAEPAAAAVIPPPPVPEMPAAPIADTAEAMAVQEAPEASAVSFAEPAEIEAAETEPVAAALVEAQADALVVAEVGSPEITDAAAEAHDEAILDMIAMEMGAPDPFDEEEIDVPIPEQAHFAAPAPAEPEIIAQVSEPMAAELVEPPLQPSPMPAVDATVVPAVEMSLGSSILASGMLTKSRMAANDPLAPIRRMSQAEKIAFFS